MGVSLPSFFQTIYFPKGGVTPLLLTTTLDIYIYIYIIPYLYVGYCFVWWWFFISRSLLFLLLLLLFCMCCFSYSLFLLFIYYLMHSTYHRQCNGLSTNHTIYSICFDILIFDSCVFGL